MLVYSTFFTLLTSQFWYITYNRYYYAIQMCDPAYYSANLVFIFFFISCSFSLLFLDGLTKVFNVISASC